MNICLKLVFVLLIMLIYYPQSLTNAGVFGQGNLDLIRENSGKYQGILLPIICGNPAYEVLSPPYSPYKRI